MREKDLPLKLSKYEFYKDTVTFLGHVISREGLILDPKKV